MLNNFWPCIGPKAKKKKKEEEIPSNLGSQFATLGANVSAFINIMKSM
jgi:superoxide dismutase